MEDAVMRSNGLKSLLVMGMVLGLMIPIIIFAFIVDERRERRDEAVKTISKAWGGSTLYGGVFIQDKKITIVPEWMQITCDMKTEVRRKGIFELPLYNADIIIKGRFPAMGRKINNANLVMMVKHLGVTSVKSLKFKNEFRSATDCVQDEYAQKMGTEIIHESGFDLTTAADFTMVVSIKGASSIMFSDCYAKKTEIMMSSDWADPSFSGSMLPTKRNIDKKGFTAQWDVSSSRQIDYNYSQLIESDMFGVSLFVPVDVYVYTNRVLKYAILFIFMTFAVFFMFEVASGLRIHPFQYLLVGGALCMFYLLLLSLSEHIPFIASYFIAAAAVVTAIGFYCRSVLKERRRSFFMAGVLTKLYIFLFILLQLEDLALLVGSLGLFALIAGLMYFTRNIDWYGTEKAKVR
jgi:inner membrane protein